MENSEICSPHLCPWWVGYFLINPLRRFYQDPKKIVGPYIRPGMKVLEVGPGMGFFTLQMAKLVGAGGRVICVEVQEKMIRTLMKRGVKAGLDRIIETRLSRGGKLGIDDIRGSVDFSLLFAVVHEIGNKEQLFGEIYASLKPGGILLFSEPNGHVTGEEYNKSIEIALREGFEIISYPSVWRSHSAHMKKRSE